MNLLFVGDVHATPGDLDECDRLMELVAETAIAHDAQVLFMGDQYDTHDVIRVEVLDFWKWTFSSFEDRKIYPKFLVGNHDQAFAGSPINAMVAHSDFSGEPFWITDRVFCISYMHDKEEFVRVCNKAVAEGALTIVCHAEFDGGKYESGMFIPNGVDPSRIKAQIISGHIHTPQYFANVSYLGSPRWRTANDDQVEERYIYVGKTTAEGITITHKIPTSGVCARTVTIQDTKESPFDLAAAKEEYGNQKFRVNIVGTREYCKERKRQLASSGVRIKVTPTTTSSIKVRASDGVENAFAKYASGFSPRHGSSMQQVVSLCLDRGLPLPRDFLVK
jgi:hypothetical protein